MNGSGPHYTPDVTLTARRITFKTLNLCLDTAVFCFSLWSTTKVEGLKPESDSLSHSFFLIPHQMYCNYVICWKAKPNNPGLSSTDMSSHLSDNLAITNLVVVQWKEQRITKIIANQNPPESSWPALPSRLFTWSRWCWMRSKEMSQS